MKVSEIMRRPVVGERKLTLAAAARRMARNRCGILPVVQDGRIVGVVTDRDVCVAMGRRRRAPWTLSVGDVMSTDVSSCRETDDVSVALEAMAARRVRRLPVLDAKGGLAGIVALDDAARRPNAAKARHFLPDED